VPGGWTPVVKIAGQREHTWPQAGNRKENDRRIANRRAKFRSVLLTQRYDRQGTNQTPGHHSPTIVL
jgi:hypothetical protein